MIAMDAALADLERILTQVQTARELRTDERVKLVIETRSKVIKKIVEINQLIAGDPRLQGDAAKTQAFVDKLTGLRHTLAALQAKWRAEKLVEDFDGYAVESRASAQACLDFVRWARSARGA